MYQVGGKRSKRFRHDKKVNLDLTIKYPHVIHQAFEANISKTPG